MNKKLSIKFISIVISIAMILTMIPVIAFNTGITAKADPFGQMVDLIPEQSEVKAELADRLLSRENAEETFEITDEFETDEDLMRLYGLDVDMGKTDRYIVKYKNGKERAFISKTADLVRTVTAIDSRIDNNTELSFLVLEEKVFPSELVQTLKTLGVGNDIEYIQPDFVLQINSLNEETEIEYTKNEIDNNDNNDVTTTSGESVLVAVIDTGMDTTHEALVEYAADGWNFPANNDVVYNQANSIEYNHGTHIAGIIAEIARGAEANVEIMPLRVFENGRAYTSDIIAAIEYADSAGAKIINCSFGSTSMNQALYDAMAASEALFVCAVGNNYVNLEEAPTYPACYILPNIISTASVNADGEFSSFSNYGGTVVDIAALGRQVLSALPNGQYGTMSGTSMSAAFVTGAAAVYCDEYTTAVDLKEMIIESANSLTAIEDKVIGGKWINLYADYTYAIQEDSIIQDYGENEYYVLTDDDQMALFSGGQGQTESSAEWHSTDGTSLNDWNGKYGNDGYILFGHNANVYVPDAVTLSGIEGQNSYGAVQVPKYKYDSVKNPGYLNNINNNLYHLQMDHSHNDKGVVIAPDSWLDPNDRPRAGLDVSSSSFTKKLTAAGVFAEGYSPSKRLTFDINDDNEHIVTFYFTSWHGGGYDLTDDGKYFKSKITFYDENNNVLLFKDNNDGWGYYYDSNEDNWGGSSHAYVSFKVAGSFSVKIEDSNKWRNLSGVFFDTEDGNNSGSSSPSVVWHATDSTSLNDWNGKFGNDGYILFGYNANTEVPDAVTLTGIEGQNSYGAVQVPKYKYDAVKDPGYLNNIDNNIYRLAVDHALNDKGVVIAPDSWLDPNDRPRAGLDEPFTKKLTAAGVFAEGYSPSKRLTFDISDDAEHIVTFYFTSWHGGGYDLTDDGKYFKSKVTFYDPNNNILLSKDNSGGWGYYYDSNGDNWGSYSHAYVSFKVKGGFSVKIEDSNKWRNLSGVFFDTVEIDPNSTATPEPTNTAEPATPEPSPTPSFSDGGSGTVNDPYIITTTYQLNNIRNIPAAHYKLAANINIGTFTPISNFTGSFDGDGYTLSNLNINQPNSDDVGLFGRTYGAAIKNVRLVNVSVVGKLYVGGIIGAATGGTVIDNCKISGNGSVKGGQYVGGLVGYCDTASIANCEVSISVDGRTDGDFVGALGGYIGGLAGCLYRNATVYNSCAEGNVTSRAQNTGGLIGGTIFFCEIYNCYATGNVTSIASSGTPNNARYAGGLVGGFGSGTIDKCYAVGNLNGTVELGGLIGKSHLGSNISNCYSAGNVILSNPYSNGSYGLLIGFSSQSSLTNCYSRGNAKDAISSKKGLIGLDDSSVVTNCYFDSAKAETNSPSAQARSTAQLGKQATFTDWDFNYTWNVDEDVTYPYLKNLERPALLVFSLQGNGTSGNPFIIETAAELNMIKYDLSAHYVLGNDINMANVSFAPIGSESAKFTGSLDGANYTISNLTIINSSDCAGLFGYASSASIKNLRLENADMTGIDYVGAIVGYAAGSTFENCFVSGSQIKGGIYVGGLIGFGISNSITECGTDVDVISGYGNSTGNYAGGLVGMCDTTSTIRDCFSFGDVSAPTNALYVGLLIGQAYSSNIKYCLSTGSAVVGEQHNGLIGHEFYNTIESCYFDSTNAGINMPGSQARTTAQLAYINTYSGWNFNNVWDVDENITYPYLRANTNVTMLIDPDAFGLEFNIQDNMVAVGDYHALAVKADGTVWSWGFNSKGQLGNGSPERIVSHMEVQSLNDITSVDAGSEHSIALKNDGTVWAWGDNTYGQLGDGTTAESFLPKKVDGLTDIVAIACGASHNLALKNDGTVWAWGNNAYGQIGNGTTANSLLPVEVTKLTDIVSIDCGLYHSLALENNGLVQAWGQNNYGQLGDGTTTNRLEPEPVSGLSYVKAISSGDCHNLAIIGDSVWTWGSNSNGQLGNGITTAQLTPIQIGGLTNIETIEGDQNNSFVIKKDGSIWAWGGGPFGDDTANGRLTPGLINNIADIKAISFGNSFGIAIKEDDSIWGWGTLPFGSDQNSDINNAVPVLAPGMNNVSLASGGKNHSVAIKIDGTVWAWGDNSHNQFGYETVSPKSSVPEQIGEDSYGTAKIYSGIYHNLLVGSSGQVWTWGNNGDGQLGDGTTINKMIPVKISGQEHKRTATAGGSHGLMVDMSGQVWAWGLNSFGQLGNEAVYSSVSPIMIPSFSGINAVAAGYSHSLALDTSGNVWAWGDNSYGQLGDGTMTNQTSPVQVMAGVKTIECGYYHSIAIKNDGTVWVWGNNMYGQLGDGTTINAAVPVQVIGLTNAAAVTGGLYHSIALKTNGEVFAWGLNSSGQLGDGSFINRITPIKVEGLSNIKDISSGSRHSLAVSSNGNLYTWGANDSGQLGRPITQCLTPILLYLPEDDYPNLFDFAEVIEMAETDDLSIEGVLEYCLDADWFAIDLETKSKASIVLDCDDADVSIKIYRIENEELVLFSEKVIGQLVLSQGIYYIKLCHGKPEKYELADYLITITTAPANYTELVVETGKNYSIAFTADEISSFNDITFEIVYDASELKPDIELFKKRADFNVQNPQALPGGMEAVKFTVKPNSTMPTIAPNNSFSGVLAVMTFKAKTDGTVTVYFNQN